ALSPAAYVNDLRSRGAIADATGHSEDVGGNPAWVGHVRAATQDGGTQDLAAAFIRRGDQMFQVLGLSQTPGGEEDARILESARSFGPLDPERANVTPDRVHVVRASSSGSFRSVVSRLGPQAISVDE